jgi:recombination protein RecT
MAYVKSTQEVKTSNLAEFNAALRAEKTQAMVLTSLRGKADEYFRNIASAVANNAELQKCDPVTLICGGLQAAQLQLPLGSGLGFAYLIPFKNNKKKIYEAQFQLGYKGLIQLAIRSGLFAEINCGEVYEGELSDFNRIAGTFKLDGERKSDKIVGYFAYFRLNNGDTPENCFSKSLYMSADEVEKHAKRYSQTYSSQYESTRNSSKWTTDFDAMARKTVLKLLLSRYAPMSVEIQKAVASDQAVVREDGVLDYVDNEQPDEQAQIEEKKEAMRTNAGETPTLL